MRLITIVVAAIAAFSQWTDALRILAAASRRGGDLDVDEDWEDLGEDFVADTAQASGAQDGGVITTPSEGFLERHPVLNVGYTVGNTVVLIRKLVANESSSQIVYDLSNKFLYLFSYRVLN